MAIGPMGEGLARREGVSAEGMRLLVEDGRFGSILTGLRLAQSIDWAWGKSGRHRRTKWSARRNVGSFLRLNVG